MVSKNFNKYSEDDIKHTYDMTRELQIKLALKRSRNVSYSTENRDGNEDAKG